MDVGLHLARDDVAHHENARGNGIEIAWCEEQNPPTIDGEELNAGGARVGRQQHLAFVKDVFPSRFAVPEPAALAADRLEVGELRLLEVQARVFDDPVGCLVLNIELGELILGPVRVELAPVGDAGPAGSGKTEALNATLSLDGVYLVGTLTEASLLSGTPRKEQSAGASGGLLREIGAQGMIVLKDFGSILSMPSEPRARVLGALREIYDGSWHRDVGVDGGRRLHWEGRVGLLAGATTVLDQHHGVMAQLGERFLLHRITVGDARKQGKASLAHHGRERKMRSELAEAIAGLFAGLSLDELPPISAADTDRLVDLAELVARARSPVVRDSYRREIELVPDSEAPGRIVGALARTLTGLRVIGVDEREAWRLTTKTGLDSMPAGRLRAFEYLFARGDNETTTDVATELGLPNPTTHRTLSDLAAHGVVARESQGQGKPDLWRVEPWAAERYGAATTSSGMSDPTL